MPLGASTQVSFTIKIRSHVCNYDRDSAKRKKKKKIYVIEILESEHSVTLSHFFTVRIQKGLGSNSNSLIGLGHGLLNKNRGMHVI